MPCTVYAAMFATVFVSKCSAREDIEYISLLQTKAANILKAKPVIENDFNASAIADSDEVDDFIPFQNLLAATDSFADSNFCLDGVHLPELFYLGSPLTGPSSFAYDSVMSGGERDGIIRQAPGKELEEGETKEWRFFEKFTPGRDTIASARSLLLQELEECPAYRSVLADFSLSNLAAVPLEDDMSLQSLSACSCGGGLSEGMVPEILSTVYGSLAKKITFMVTLREPISRMQSAWYHGHRNNFDSGWLGMENCCQDSWSASVQTIIDANMQGTNFKFGTGMGGSAGPWASMYARQLAQYLKFFDATQFVIVPFTSYFDGNKSLACKTIARHVGLDKVCSDGEPFDSKRKDASHPKVENDLTGSLLGHLRHFFGEENSKLFDLLGQMHKDGADLVGYNGPSGEPHPIKEWLTARW